MLRRIALVVAFLVASLSVLSAQQLKLRITAPEDKAAVSERPIAEGTVANPSAKVWVIVHPMEVADYWVQQAVTVNTDGTWEVQIDIGRPGTVDVGKRFEIVAVANPKARFRKGDVLGGWPLAQWKSQVVRVTRK